MSLGKGGGIQDPKDPLIYCEDTFEERESDSDDSDRGSQFDDQDHEDGSWCCCMPGGHELRKKERRKKEIELALRRLDQKGSGLMVKDDPCACHDDEDETVNWKAQCQLIIAVVIAFLFMTAEVIGEASMQDRMER